MHFWIRGLNPLSVFKKVIIECIRYMYFKNDYAFTLLIPQKKCEPLDMKWWFSALLFFFSFFFFLACLASGALLHGDFLCTKDILHVLRNSLVQPELNMKETCFYAAKKQDYFSVILLILKKKYSRIKKIRSRWH